MLGYELAYCRSLRLDDVCIGNDVDCFAGAADVQGGIHTEANTGVQMGMTLDVILEALGFDSHGIVARREVSDGVRASVI